MKLPYNAGMANLRSVLLAWRDNESAKKGVELFRVLPNSAIDEIVRAMPTTKEELTAIKGIKEAKYQSYGLAILNMVKEHSGGATIVAREPDAMMPIGEGLPQNKKEDERTLFSVSTYLDIINRELWRLRATIKGEVTSFKVQGNAVYFSIRDTEDASALSVFMWMNDFNLAGIELSEGLEVIIGGRSEIFKPTGRFNFRADSIELVGEGAFKKAYDALKKKMDEEGLFDVARKRILKEHPIKIGLVTSRTGAVIHDFLNNLGRFGYQTTFVDSRVEGGAAVKDILSALSYLESRDIDVLVVIRGGGSLESLQAFNNEHVVRKIASFPAVTICAIGHDKDVPLAQLVADYAPSTPTASTIILNNSWESTVHELQIIARGIQSRYGESLWTVGDVLMRTNISLESRLEHIIRPFRQMITNFNELTMRVARSLASGKDTLEYGAKQIMHQYVRQLKDAQGTLDVANKSLIQNNPMRQLKLGYSILTQKGKVLRSVENIHIGESFEARVMDGTLVSELKQKNKK